MNFSFGMCSNFGRLFRGSRNGDRIEIAVECYRACEKVVWVRGHWHHHQEPLNLTQHEKIDPGRAPVYLTNEKLFQIQILARYCVPLELIAIPDNRFSIPKFEHIPKEKFMNYNSTSNYGQ